MNRLSRLFWKFTANLASAPRSIVKFDLEPRDYMMLITTEVRGWNSKPNMTVRLTHWFCPMVSGWDWIGYPGETWWLIYRIKKTKGIVGVLARIFPWLNFCVNVHIFFWRWPIALFWYFHLFFERERLNFLVSFYDRFTTFYGTRNCLYQL